MAIKEYDSIRVTLEGKEPAKDPVLVEETIDLLLNGRKISSIVTTPEQHKELVVGYLITEGAIQSKDDILGVKEKGQQVDVSVRSFDHFDLWYELRSSGCIGIHWEQRDDDITIPVSQLFPAKSVLGAVKYLYSEEHDLTKGAHTACLIDAEGNLLYKAQDVGRHNAVDKVIGAATLGGVDVTKLMLLSSGRQPAGMVMKAVRTRIPLIGTKGAPMSSGIDSARRANLTLVCYNDGKKAKIFSAPERVVV
jgi:FdhD protein